MGYACPVCGDPQADAGHLANHLAITAIARGGDHETWLDEHVPDWTERGEDDLASAVSEQASEADYPQVFEDTTGDGADHDHDHSDGPHRDLGSEALAEDLPVDVAGPGRGPTHNDGELDAATREAIRRAREMGGETTADGDGGETTADGDGGEITADGDADSDEAQAAADDSETE